MNVLFVCTGNTCRSPMCEAYFNDLCAKANRRDIRAKSCGIYADSSMPASAQSTATMCRYGIDLSGHKSTPASQELIDWADIIIAMTRSHKFSVAAISKDAAGKTRLLLEYADRKDSDVADPFGGSTELYTHCFEEMKGALDNLFLDISSSENK